MHVVATAGHVDHGKSTLVDTLTGMRSDRLHEERERGLSIELGYVWTTLPDAGQVAFVDVPGHERFVTTMLAGIGPVPAVLLVVAADDPWMPQAAEHLAALDALGVAHGVVAVTRADLADPGPMMERAAAEVARTSLRGAPVVPVSAPTGAGLLQLRTELAAMVRRLPDPDPDADVRLWADRVFTVRGAGTVVTGTLPAGTISSGQELEVAAADGRATVRIRAVQSLGAPVGTVSGVARVALNVTGDGARLLDRGVALLTPGAWWNSQVVDCRITGDHGRVPELPVLHVGATAVSVRTRALAPGDVGDLVRLTLRHPLPLRVGDRALLRDPGSRRIWGVQVLDPAPPTLRRRGAAAARATALARLSGTPDPASELERRGVVSADLLHRIGVPLGALPADTVAAGSWLMSGRRADEVAAALVAAVTEHDRAHPLDPGVAPGALAARLGLPAAELVTAAVRPPLRLDGGRVVAGEARPALPPAVERALAALERDLAKAPYAAPTADRLAQLGLDDRACAAAARAGRLLRLAPGIVLLPGADRQAATWLAQLPQPFTTSEARQRLGTSRRVVLPLLDHLDRARLTRRLPDDRREVPPGR